MRFPSWKKRAHSYQCQPVRTWPDQSESFEVKRVGCCGKGLLWHTQDAAVNSLATSFQDSRLNSLLFLLLLFSFFNAQKLGNWQKCHCWHQEILCLVFSPLAHHFPSFHSASFPLLDQTCQPCPTAAKPQQGQERQERRQLQRWRRYSGRHGRKKIGKKTPQGLCVWERERTVRVQTALSGRQQEEIWRESLKP